jgi:hypothetical protein
MALRSLPLIDETEAGSVEKQFSEILCASVRQNEGGKQ